MENNNRVSKLNVRGSHMNPDKLGYIWLGLLQNTSITDFEYQREKVVFAFDTLKAVENELTLNLEINNTILPIIKQ